MSETSVFEIQTTTWGVESDKYGKYKLPIVLGDHPDVIESVKKLASDNNVEAPLYGKSQTLYLRLNTLTNKQKKDLLDKKRQTVKVKFEFTDVYKDKYMCFKVLKLGKVQTQVQDAPEDY